MASHSHQVPGLPGRLGHILHTMQQTGFHAWGFVIYRGCAYDDDASWHRFFHHMKQQVHEALHATITTTTTTTPTGSGTGTGTGTGIGSGTLASSFPAPPPPPLDTTGRQLLPFLQWTLVQDPSLQGASKATVRRHFAAWAAARHPDRDGPGADGPYMENYVPRFAYCVYVDERCLQTLAAFDDWVRLDRNGPMQYLACIILDKNCPDHGEGDAGFMPPVDGCDRYYTGWMYAHVGSLPELYNTLGHQRLFSGANYARPPKIYPGHLYGATIQST